MMIHRVQSTFDVKIAQNQWAKAMKSQHQLIFVIFYAFATIPALCVPSIGDRPSIYFVAQIKSESVPSIGDALLLETCPSIRRNTLETDLSYYQDLYSRFLETESKVVWEEIGDVPKNLHYNYEQLHEGYDLKIEQETDLLKRLVVIKLNGGLGTSMGCGNLPKSLTEVREGMTFLDVTLRQIQHLNSKHTQADIPLLLLNSFNTTRETAEALRKHGYTGTDGCWQNAKHNDTPIFCVEQSKCPRIDAETLMPLVNDVTVNSDECWYPPGHGNLLFSLEKSGTLDTLLNNGRQYAFVSNIDNLCATVDCAILSLMIRSQRPYAMEVTDRTELDTKCGTLIQYRGRVVHLETPLVPEEHLKEFQSVQRFKSLNTNSIWLDLKCVKELLSRGGAKTEILVNTKKLSNGRKVLQLETAIGGAIQAFPGACCVHVPRNRFAPVKRADALILISSDAYRLCKESGKLELTNEHNGPQLQLDPRFYSTVDDIKKRFPHGSPSMKNLKLLRISGDVSFGKNVVLAGTVLIDLKYGEQLYFGDKTILSNVTIGNVDTE